MQGANSKNKTFKIIIKSHIMSIVKVQSVAPVHFRVGKCHQMKKRPRMWLLSKVFTDLEKVFSLKWRCPPREAFHWRRGERSADPAVYLLDPPKLVLKDPRRAPKMKDCCWITRIHRDSWPPGGEEFNLGPETRLDRSELLCNKDLLKYKGDRESFWHRHQKGAERVPAC